MQYQNFDMKSIVTPVNIAHLKQLLYKTNYNKEESSFLVDGFENGFSIGYQGRKNIRITAPNLKFTVGNSTVLWNKVMKEVKEKCYAGPFRKAPFKHFIQPPIGLVPKDSGKDVRLIFHLSYPRTDNSTSVNANTPPELCKVQYPDFCDAIQLCLQEGKGCKISRSDMEAAFRNLRIKRCHFRYLVMVARNPDDGELYWFFDKCLPFGASISCSHFQRFSNCVAFMVCKCTGKPL